MRKILIHRKATAYLRRMPPQRRGQMMAALDHTGMFAQDVPLGRHNQAIWIDPQADRSIGE